MLQNSLIGLLFSLTALVYGFISDCLGLRPAKPKPVRRTKTNAEACKDYRERLKADADRLEAFKKTKKLSHQKWLANRSDEQIAKDKANAAARQRKKRYCVSCFLLFFILFF